MEYVRFQNDVTAALHPSDALDENSSKFQSLTKNNWNELKPTIRELYLDQGQTLKQLAKYLEEHHGFRRPSKKQLLYRISEWGFEKNVKKNERRAIIEHLGPGLGKMEFEARKLRGRTLDETKLNRWMKLEKITFEESLVEANEVACIPVSVVPPEQKFGPTNQGSEERARTQISNSEEKSKSNLQVQESHSVPVLRYSDNSFDWNSVDVIGSPGLTKLIGALTIEECDIPPLDLASNSLGVDDLSGSDLMDLCGGSDSAQEDHTKSKRNSWSTRLSTWMNTFQTFENFGKSSQFGPQFELYPFPTSSSQFYIVDRLFPLSGSLKPKMSESECTIKLQKLKHLRDTEIIHLVEAMGARAEDLYDQERYKSAETWFRRVVRAKRFVKWHKPHQTLWACLVVARCLYMQDRFKEAQRLQQSLHGTIEQVFSSDHDISVQSRELNADIFDVLGFFVEGEAVRRQVLQIRLNYLGPRHPKTINALEDLGSCLGILERNSEAQHLLETAIHFHLQTVKDSEDYSEGQIETIGVMTALAEVLNRNRKYDDSENVLEWAHYIFGDATRRRSWNYLAYHYEKANTYWLQGRLEKSEKILRGLLKYHLSHMDSATSMNSMIDLAKILEETDRYREAAFWRKKEYLLSVKIYGLTHSYAMDSCRHLGFCYADQSRYDEGKLFFEEVIEMLRSNSEEADSRTVCVQKINSWVEELEEMRAQDSSEWGSKTTDPVDAEREPIVAVDGVNYEDMYIVSDPLDW